jgi:hypothetical protein
MNTIRKSIRKRLAWLLWPSGHSIVRRDGVLYLLDLEGYKRDKYILQWGAPEKEQSAFLSTISVAETAKHFSI